VTPATQGDTAERLARAALVVEAALERKAEDVVALDVRGVTSFADTFVLATGRSARQVRAIADAILEAVEARGERVLGIEGKQEGRWVLIDLGDVIVHLFQPEVRAHYDLDRLWSDAPPLAIEGAARRRVKS
jgi:ribosome-associated protein